MPQFYSVKKDSVDEWRIDDIPATSPPTTTALTVPDWETVWSSIIEQDAIDNCPAGFSVGPRPPKPH